MSAVILDGPTGGGGRLIGPLIAKDLGYDYVDRLILTEAARHIGATVEAYTKGKKKYLVGLINFHLCYNAYWKDLLQVIWVLILISELVVWLSLPVSYTHLTLPTSDLV